MALSQQLLRRPPGRRGARGLGFSLVEVLVTMSIMLVLAATAYVYYGAVLPEQRIGRAKTDIQQYKKAVGVLKSSYKPGPLTSDVFHYEEDGPPWPPENQRIRYRPDEDPSVDPGFDKLLKYQIVPSLILDPWGGDYRINVQRGWIYSYGPDGVRDQEGQEADDVIDSYQPEFLPVRARLAAGKRYLDVEFSREISRDVRDADGRILYSVTGDNFSVPGASILTAVVDFASPFIIRLRLDEKAGVPTEVVVKREAGPNAKAMRSADAATLSTDQVRLTTRSASGGMYVPPVS